jgi:hypothetical protein
MLPALAIKPQDNDSAMVLRGIGAEVTEPNIECQQCPHLKPAPFDHLDIFDSAQIRGAGSRQS